MIADRISELRTRGLSTNEIIKTLQKEGHNSKEIFEALSTTLNNNPQVSNGMTGPSPFDTPPQAAPSAAVPPSRMPPPIPPMSHGAGVAQVPESVSGPSDEELIEAIIDEKWNDLMGDINKIIAWKERTEQKITAIGQQMKDLKEQFDKLHQAVIGKVGEYDQHILHVGAEVKAMEKVFSKVLPVFMENVSELSNIADVFKSTAAKLSDRKKMKK